MDLTTKVAQLLKDQTNEMFSEKWYNQTSNKINILYSSDLKGYVYFVQSVLTKQIKIGITADVKKRISTIKQTNGDLIFLGFIYCENYLEKEKEMHNIFSENRTYGEWFNITVESCLDKILFNDGKVVNQKYSESLIIEDGVLLSDLTSYLSNTDKHNYKVVLEYIKNKTFKNTRYDLKQIYNELSLEITPKKCTQFIQKSVNELGYVYEPNRTHKSRGFIYR